MHSSLLIDVKSLSVISQNQCNSKNIKNIFGIIKIPLLHIVSCCNSRRERLWYVSKF